MSQDFTVASEQDCIRLGGELTIYNAAALKEQLFALVKRGAPVEVDASEITAIDSSGLQILLMLRKIAASDLRVYDPSAVAREVFELCGLHELIAIRKASAA